MADIADIHELHSILPGAQEQHVAGDVDAGGEFHGIIPGNQPDMGRIVYIDNPTAALPRAGEKRPVLDDHLAYKTVNSSL